MPQACAPPANRFIVIPLSVSRCGMKSKLLLVVFLLLSGNAAIAQSNAARPKITGISHLAVYTSNPTATEHYYTVTIGAAKEPDPENPKGARYVLSPTQFIEVLPLPAD